MYLGIDFSGGADPWKARCSRPTVWVAVIENNVAPRLTELRPVQSLPGDGEPFTRLLALLRAGDFAAAGIDAPFAIPAKYLPPGGHVELLHRVGRLSPVPDRPFASGAALVGLAAEIAPLDQKRPHRETERVWVERGVNTRSTLWNGPRGGAAFTAACLTLLARSGRPVWPWNCGPGMLVEAFPAAQLLTWAMPHNGYNKPEQHDAREQILVGLAKHLNFTASQRHSMLRSPDALDAVIAAFAAIAAVPEGAPAEYPADGLIAVLDDGGSRTSCRWRRCLRLTTSCARSQSVGSTSCSRRCCADRACGSNGSYREDIRQRPASPTCRTGTSGALGAHGFSPAQA